MDLDLVLKKLKNCASMDRPVLGDVKVDGITYSVTVTVGHKFLLFGKKIKVEIVSNSLTNRLIGGETSNIDVQRKGLDDDNYSGVQGASNGNKIECDSLKFKKKRLNMVIYDGAKFTSSIIGGIHQLSKMYDDPCAKIKKLRDAACKKPSSPQMIDMEIRGENYAVEAITEKISSFSKRTLITIREKNEKDVSDQAGITFVYDKGDEIAEKVRASVNLICLARRLRSSELAKNTISAKAAEGSIDNARATKSVYGSYEERVVLEKQICEVDKIVGVGEQEKRCVSKKAEELKSLLKSAKLLSQTRYALSPSKTLVEPFVRELSQVANYLVAKLGHVRRFDSVISAIANNEFLLLLEDLESEVQGLSNLISDLFANAKFSGENLVQEFADARGKIKNLPCMGGIR
ncbi:MAG: hypothetical protein LBB18_01845 [Puniceicoccales bacterium]|nr:hypothetical protein [Puniceicoccales bacterium]